MAHVLDRRAVEHGTACGARAGLYVVFAVDGSSGDTGVHDMSPEDAVRLLAGATLVDWSTGRVVLSESS
jgi:hypothetical protein